MDSVHATVVTSVDAMAETIIARLDRAEDTEPVVLADQVSYAMSQSHRILLSCQPRVTVTSCFVYKVIRDQESIDRLCMNPIRRI